MAYRNPDLIAAAKRLDWDKLPHINYYGKKHRGKKRKYYKDEYEEETPISPMKNGYYFIEESPFSKAANSVLSFNAPSPSPEKETRSLGIQAILLKSSHFQRDQLPWSENEEEIKKKKIKKKVKRMVIKKLIDSEQHHDQNLTKMNIINDK